MRCEDIAGERTSRFHQRSQRAFQSRHEEITAELVVREYRNGTVYRIHRAFVLSYLLLSVFVTVSYVVISLLLVERGAE